MIVVEQKLQSIFEQIPDIQINASVSRSPRFGWGDEKELNRYLQLKKDDSYPLIWYLMPTKEKHSDFSVNVECALIVATRETRQDLLNDQRYILSFDLVLMPLAEYIIEGLKTSGISTLTREEWEIIKYPNFSDSGKESPTIDLWDAIKINCNVEITDNCLKTIKWLKKT